MCDAKLGYLFTCFAICFIITNITHRLWRRNQTYKVAVDTAKENTLVLID